MNKSTKENLSLEPQPNNELKADEMHVSPDIGNTNVVCQGGNGFTKDDMINIISLTYNLSRKGEFIGDEWLYEFPYYDDILEKIRTNILYKDERKTFTDDEIKEMAAKEIIYNDIKRAWWIEGAKFINNKIKNK